MRRRRVLSSGVVVVSGVHCVGRLRLRSDGGWWHNANGIHFAVVLGDDEAVSAFLPAVEDVHLPRGLVPEAVEVVVHVLQLLQRLLHRERRHLEHLGAHHLGEHRLLVLSAHGRLQVVGLGGGQQVGRRDLVPDAVSVSAAAHLRLLLLDLAELALDDGGGEVDAGVGGLGVLLGAQDAMALGEEGDLAARRLGAPAELAAARGEAHVYLPDQVAVLGHRPTHLVLDVLLELLAQLRIPALHDEAHRRERTVPGHPHRHGDAAAPGGVHGHRHRGQHDAPQEARAAEGQGSSSTGATSMDVASYCGRGGGAHCGCRHGCFLSFFLP
uniref:Uncharacterized protein n=1 Tax=Zea mays TaxID=4577 RepID=C0PND1_MAIZE|nr:unknown [Zea mays]